MEIKNKKLFITILSAFLLLFSVNQALAICEGPLVPCGREGTPACTLCHLFQLLNNILEFILTCITPLMTILMFTAAGIMFMLSHMEMLPMDIFSQAKGAITAVIVGLFITFIAWVFLNTFLTIVGIAEWTGLQKWWEIECVPSSGYNNENTDFLCIDIDTVIL
jgi:hypothetical protein